VLPLSLQGQPQDYLGAFAVAIHGVESHLKQFADQHDDYNKIMIQALSDRLVESFAEYLHEQVRKKYWGYAAEENLDFGALIKESYQGIRPAPGYPACPDHTEKLKLFHVLNASENAGIHLTENLAMTPAASVCGWYFAHPESRYFGVGKIMDDQFQDYLQRKKMPEDELRKWLRENLE
jgi:5-methyltetrahydrofolate--homocysteine methyltransferase